MNLTRRVLLTGAAALAAPAIVRAAGQGAHPHRRDQQLHRDPLLHPALPQRLAARASSRSTPRAACSGRKLEVISRDDARQAAGRGAARRRTGGRAEGRSAGRRLSLQCRPGALRFRAAAQAAVRRRRAADRRAGVGEGQPLLLPAAPVDLHAGGDAGRGSGEAAGEALGDAWRRTTNTASRR